MTRRQQEVVLVPKDRSRLAVTVTLIVIFAGWFGVAVWLGVLFLHKWAS